MSKDTTGTEAGTETKVAAPVALSDDQMGTVAGGYSREDWVLINKEIEKILHPK